MALDQVQHDLSAAREVARLGVGIALTPHGTVLTAVGRPEMTTVGSHQLLGNCGLPFEYQLGCTVLSS